MLRKSILNGCAVSVLLMLFGFLSCGNGEKQAEKHFRKGFRYQAEGDLEGALQEYDKALQLNPNYVQVYTNRGTVYLGKKDYARAIQDFEEVIKRSYFDRKAHYNLGLAYLYKGDKEKAEEKVKFLQSLNSDLADNLERKIAEK